jgi:bisphosphoglycerate-dependent phosphoglycerate mutase
MMIEKLSPAEIAEVEVGTAEPLVYHLDGNFRIEKKGL